jgi:hypothetical protein
MQHLLFSGPVRLRKLLIPTKVTPVQKVGIHLSTHVRFHTLPGEANVKLLPKSGEAQLQEHSVSENPRLKVRTVVTMLDQTKVLHDVH